MQGRGEGRNSLLDFGDPFACFGGFGSQKGLISNFFGGRNPFNDPLLRSSFESFPGSGDKKKENPRKHAPSSRSLMVRIQDEAEAEGRRYRNYSNRMNNTLVQPQTQSFTLQSSSVSYGGANGAYYTTTTTRRTRTGSDGLTFEESKGADKATTKAAHRISRGIQNKDHSVTTKLNPVTKELFIINGVFLLFHIHSFKIV